jgi:hypothetical protein
VNEKEFVLKVFRRMFSDLVSLSLCESAVDSIVFVLRNRLGGDPFEVFWENPKFVYDELRRIFGDGTNVLINMWVKAFRQRATSNVNPEEFLRHLQSNDPRSIEKVRSMLKELAKSYYETCEKVGGEG